MSLTIVIQHVFIILEYKYYNTVVFKPLHEVSTALHILYVSLHLTHPLQVL